jgi:hypothetical protein
MHNRAALTTIKVIHTIAWAVFAACILVIPIAAMKDNFTLAFGLIAIVLVEVLVLVANGMRCPLTKVAARYTDARHDNFDIYLPLWLARYNKHIFGTMFIVAVLVTMARWLGYFGSAAY